MSLIYIIGAGITVAGASKALRKSHSRLTPEEAQDIVDRVRAARRRVQAARRQNRP